MHKFLNKIISSPIFKCVTDEHYILWRNEMLIYQYGIAEN